MRYLDEAIELRCFVDLLKLELFPNAKEVTESFGICQGIFSEICNDRHNPNITVVIPGDGSKPRTAATIVHRTLWSAISIDPALKNKQFPSVKRLTCINKKIEEINTIKINGFAILAFVHSHASMATTLDKIEADRTAIIAMPCCKAIDIDIPCDLTYVDHSILSPKNTIHIWKDIRNG